MLITTIRANWSITNLKYERLIKCQVVATLISMAILIPQSLLYAASMEEVNLGEYEFVNNCAVCHGIDGKGNGPMSEQLTKIPSDLTILSKSNGGSFPETVIYQLIDGRRVVVNDEGLTIETFHGSRDMPVWGDTFRAIEGDEGAVDEIISNLLVYLKDIQIK